MNIKSFCAKAALILALLLPAATVNASPVDGRHSASFIIDAKDFKFHDVVLEPNSFTLFTLVGDGDGDIDCHLVQESTDEIVVRDNRSSDSCLMRVYSRYGGRYRLFVRNVGDEPTMVSMSIH